MTDQHKTWPEMTAAEKGAMLLAQHEGKVIEILTKQFGWVPWPGRYLDETFQPVRIRPAPKRETVVMPVASRGHGWSQYSAEIDGSHRITFDTIDGKPDCGSIRMEEIE